MTDANKNAELDEEFAKLPEKTQQMIQELGTEWGEEMKQEQEQAQGMTIQELLAQAPRKLKRKLQPEKKFGNQLLARLKK